MKKLISFVLTFLIIISSLSGLNTVVFATNSNTITLGSAVTVTEDSVTYTFTTEKAGAYVMYSQGEGCLCALLYNSDGNTITSGFQNAEDGRGFYLEKVLGANSTYSIEVYNRYPEEVPTDYELNVEKLESDGALAVGTEAKINKKEAYHTFTPTVSGYYYFYTTGTCDTYGELYDSAGAKIYDDDNFGIEGNYRLEYYLTAEDDYVVYTKSWYTYDEYDIGLCVIPFSVDAEIEEGEVHTVTDKWDILSFTASKTATYRFYSVEEEDYDYNTQYYGKIYNSDYEVVSYVNEEIYSPNNFFVECEMTAGETYYLDSCMLWYNEYSPEAYDVTIGEVSPITSLQIMPLDGTVAGVNEDLHCELIINPSTHKSEEIFWSITPERVGRIEYYGEWGASIELHSPGIAEVRAYTASGVATSYIVTCEGELPEIELNETKNAYIEYSEEIHAYTFTAEEEGYYGFLSKGNELDLKVALYEQGETEPFKTETSKGDGDNFNVQFYNDVPGTEYIVEVAVECDENDYENHSGNYKLIAYVPTEEVQGVKIFQGNSYTVYADGELYTFNALLVPETANLYALEFAVWQLTGDAIGYQTVYGRNFVKYGFYNPGVATLTVSIESGEFSDSCVITSKEVGYSDILLDEVKTVNASGHQSEGWFKFVPEEDGEYTFYSTGNADIDMYSNGNYCDYDSGYNYNFMYTVELSAGEEFYFECTPCSYEEQEKYYVSVCKAHNAESITIIEDPSNINEVGNYGIFSVKMGNGGAYYDRFDELIWDINDKTIAEVSYYYDDGKIELYFCGEGVATLTVTAPEGFSDSLDIYVGIEPPKEVKPGDINGDNEINSQDLTNLRITLLLNDNIDYNDNVACDTNGDGEINIIDLIRLKKYLVGFDITLGKG